MYFHCTAQWNFEPYNNHLFKSTQRKRHKLLKYGCKLSGTKMKVVFGAWDLQISDLLEMKSNFSIMRILLL